MTTSTASPVRHTIKRIRRVWSELTYAQRRLFEIRTGVLVAKPSARRRATATAEQLEALYRAS